MKLDFLDNYRFKIDHEKLKNNILRYESTDAYLYFKPFNKKLVDELLKKLFQNHIYKKYLNYEKLLNNILNLNIEYQLKFAFVVYITYYLDFYYYANKKYIINDFTWTITSLNIEPYLNYLYICIQQILKNSNKKISTILVPKRHSSDFSILNNIIEKIPYKIDLKIIDTKFIHNENYFLVMNDGIPDFCGVMGAEHSYLKTFVSKFPSMLIEGDFIITKNIDKEILSLNNYYSEGGWMIFLPEEEFLTNNLLIPDSTYIYNPICENFKNKYIHIHTTKVKLDDAKKLLSIIDEKLLNEAFNLKI